MGRRPNIKITIAYDGSEFYGSQKQREEPTVQSALEEALEELNMVPTTAHFSGRTDSGVHAWGQVVCFEPSVNIPVQRWPRALNGILPGSLVVRSADEVSAGHDPVRDARWKHYRYSMTRTRPVSPFSRRYVTAVPRDVRTDWMRQGAAELMGTKDFASFQVSGRPVSSTIRTIYQLAVTEEEDAVLVDLVASGFLYKMARSIVGTLIEVGRGAIQPSDLRSILAARDRSIAGPTAPAGGLCLVRVKY